MDGESVSEGMNTPETGSTISDHPPSPSGQDILLLNSLSAPLLLLALLVGVFVRPATIGGAPVEL